MKQFSRLAFTSVVLCTLGLFSTAGCNGGSDGTGGAGGNAAGSVQVQVSGEDLATNGFLFPDGSEVRIADGWEVKFSHILLSLQSVSLNENPDKAPSDQSQMGNLVAQEVGPWVVDLAKEGDVPGAGGEGSAFKLVTIGSQNKNGNAPLSAGERYAVSFDVAPPNSSASLVNADDAETKALFDQMVSSKWSVLYSGTATFKGTACSTSDESYDFSKLPTTVNFVFGFASPTTYTNCQNQENQGDPFDGEEYQRGVTIQENRESVAQLTLHLEHPFYSETQHEPALYFDQLAALLVGQPEDTVLTLNFTKSVDPSAFTDGEGTPLPWRSCDGSTIPGAKQRSFDTGSVPLNPGGNPQSALRDYYDYIHYVQSTQGHMNGGEGLCYIQRNYPSPD